MTLYFDVYLINCYFFVRTIETHLTRAFTRIYVAYYFREVVDYSYTPFLRKPMIMYKTGWYIEVMSSFAWQWRASRGSGPQANSASVDCHAGWEFYIPKSRRLQY
jgi:hypothetical protein